MAKLLVDVRTPGNGKTYEFELDSRMSVVQAKARLIDEVVEFENGNITFDHENTILCNLSTCTRLCDTDTLFSSGVRSGHTLLLL